MNEPPPNETALQREEREALATLRFHESQMANGMRTVGTHLKAIRDSQCYRFIFATFDDYVQQRLSISRFQAHRIIETTEIAQRLSNDSASTRELQAFANALNPEQAAVIRKLPPDRRVEVVQKAVDTAKEAGRKVTAKHIEETAREIIDVESTPVESPPEDAYDDDIFGFDTKGIEDDDTPLPNLPESHPHGTTCPNCGHVF